MEPPTLSALTLVFLSIGAQSFGGGMSAWMRREVVQKKGWMNEQTFASGMALCQIAPGPNATNLAVFIGTTLRGRSGALAALVGMLLVPAIFVIFLGIGLVWVRDVPGVGSAMAGLGCAAIGLNIATGLRMARRGLRRPAMAAVALALLLSVGVAGLPLLAVLVVAVPVAILLAGKTA